MKILFISTEAVPYYKTGGVADVVHGLARELCLEGHDARIAIPRYRALAGQPALKKLVPGLKVSLGDYERWGTVWKAQDEPAAYLIEQEFYFGRNDLYDYPDDYERFIFFTRGVLDMLASQEFQEAEAGWFPEVIQGYDWATGLVPSWLPEYARQDPRFTAARFVLFIYNIRRAGVFGSRALQIAGQKEQGIYPRVGETPEQVSFLGRGALFADKIVTGSHISSSDRTLPEMAQKVVAILESRKADWEVIPNAIDNQDYDPADSLRIPHPFTNETVGKERWKNKLALQDELKMKHGKEIPLLGMVSRLIPENGFDLFPRLIEKLKGQGESQLAVLAEPGDAESMLILQDLERSSPSGAAQIKSRFSFDEGLARRIYAGCDIYLIPSLHMPSGIQQLIAMHFGAIPVVYATGALRHSVEHYQRSAKPSRQHGRGTGFVFEEYTADVFADTVLQAIDLYRTNPGQWLSIQRYNMRLDFTWYESASQYLDLYQALQSQPTRVSPPQGTELRLNPDAHLLQAIIEIDNLPGLKYRESIRILKQAARLVRGVINCDAVYVWELGEGLELGSLDTDGSKFVVAEKSLANHRESEIDDHEVAHLLHQGVSNAWRQLADIDANGICQPILGLEASPLAQKQGWVLGRSVPITAHGRALGRIDVLFTQKQIDELYLKQHKDATWLASALTALASSFGLRLETIRYANEADQISEIGRKLLSARSVKEAAQKVVELAKQLTNAEHAWLYLNHDGTLEALEQDEITDCGKPLAEAQLSVTEPEPRATYMPEWGNAPRDAQGHRLYRSLMVVPLADIRKDQAFRVNGILEVAKVQPATFNRDQEHMLLRHLGPQAAVVLETTLENDRRGQEWVQQLTSLSESLVGGGGFQQLLEKVVDTTTEVLHADAASLYLTDEKNQKLLIQAASGYQAPLVAERASYAWGEGVTGKIAETKKPFLANLLSDLRERGGGPRGKYDDLQGGKQPESFYGLPLVVKGREQPIGVLKFESLKPEFFTDETVLLIQMMASVIATVVYNTQLSRDQLSEFSANLGRLSGALAASGGMEALMTSIVDTATEVLNADAASLYLADEKNQKLLIQAASGYQAPLKPAGASYLWGEGVTGRIAETGQPFLANSLPDLRQRGSGPRGKYDDLQGGLQPASFYGLPMIVKGRERPIGVLKVESLKPEFFTGETVLLIQMMAGVIAAVVYNTQLSRDRLSEFSANLERLSDALAASGGMEALMTNIVDTATEVLHADAASLYLTDEKNQALLIQAASGYQAPLKLAGASYLWGEGVTGRIAKTGKPFLAKSKQELRGSSPVGKYDHLHLQGSIQPESFYGLPLVVKGREQPIGVLKFESLKPEFFTDETVLLIQMMASVIATVVYNTQLSRDRLSEFSANLGRLSGALAASQGMDALMANIINTTTEVLHADAASLYLADEKNQKLLIQAASGYQSPLKPAGASYLWGEGVTGRIAETGQPFLANSLPDLRQRGGGPRGKYDDLQGGLQPASFYGLPMIVKGRERPIGVLKVESLRTNFFTPEDVLLIDMMGNVIATVVYNAQTDQKQLLEFLEDLGSLAYPRPDASRVIFTRLAQSSERGLNEPLAKALAVSVGDDHEKAYQEALKLLEVGAGSQVFASIADDSLPGARRRFSLFASAMRNSNIEPHNLQRVFDNSHRWAALEESSGTRQTFEAGVTAFMEEFCHGCGAKINGSAWEGKWFGLSLDTSRTFQDTYLPDRLSFAFHRSGSPQNETDLEDLNNLLENRLNYVKKWVALPMWGDVSVVKRAEEMLLTKSQQTDAIEVINLDINKIQQMVGKSRPDIELQREVLAQVRLTSISPYLPRTPAGKRIFFGRENEIRQMVEGLQEKEGELSKSYSIIGGRRIGKTSILLQLHTVRLRSSNFYTVYKDCAPVSWANFLSSPIGLTDWQPKAPQDPPMTFGELLSSTAMDQLVLLLDEIDDLVAKDRENDWRLFKTMRSLAHSGRAHVILSGERTLREALHDSNGPLFNFTYPIRLGPLDRPNVDKLVTHPLKQLGIQFEQEETILETIFNFTSGHPQVVNSLCERLIGRITEKQTRCIRPEDVMDVIEDPGFIRDEFLETYFSKATVLEHLCALLMAQNQKLVTGSAVRQALSKLDVLASLNQVDAALERLVDLRNILVRKKVGYAFQVAAFPRIISVSEQMSDMIALRREIFNDLGDISPENAPLNYQGRLW